MKNLVSEHSVARMLLTLQSALWPGGVWFSWANQQQEKYLNRKQRRASLNRDDDNPRGQPFVPTWLRSKPMKAEAFLEAAVRSAHDDAEVAQKVSLLSLHKIWCLTNFISPDVHQMFRRF
jgi:hypothetical protein